MSTTFIIGIDPGAKTGIAVWSVLDSSLVKVETMTHIKALFFVKQYQPTIAAIVFEDARQRTWFGKTGREVLQGAGSIKARCADWEEFCTLFKYQFFTVKPQEVRSIDNAANFAKVTKWTKRTSVHARDAAMMVFKMTPARFSIEQQRRSAFRIRPYIDDASEADQFRQ